MQQGSNLYNLMYQHGKLEPISDYVRYSGSQRLIASSTAVLCLAVAITLLLNPVAPIVIAGFSISMFVIPLLLGAVSSLYAANCHLCIKHFDNLAKQPSPPSATVVDKPSLLNPRRSDELAADQARRYSDESTASPSDEGSDEEFTPPGTRTGP